MYTRIAQLRTPEQFAEHIQSLGIQLDFDAELISVPGSPLARPYILPNIKLTNRFCIPA